MAVTKDKFGVPIDGNRLGILQPKLRYRFRVIMTGFGAGGRSDELTSNVVSVTRPTLGYEVVPLTVITLEHTFKVSILGNQYHSL